MANECVEIPISGLYRGAGGIKPFIEMPPEEPRRDDEFDDRLDYLEDEAKRIRNKLKKYDANGANTLRMRNLFPKTGTNNGTGKQAARNNHKHYGTEGGVSYERTIPWYIPGSLVAGSNQGAEYTLDGVDLPAGTVITLKKATGRVKTAPVGAAIILDIIYTPPGGAGASIFVTKLTIADGATNGTSTAFVLPDSRMIGGVFRINIDQAGSTTPGSSLTVQLTIMQLTTIFTIISS